MGRKDVSKLKSRAEDSWETKRLWEDKLEEVYEFAMPNRNRYEDQDESPGQSKTDRLYDSTAIESTQAFASKLQNKLVPPFEEWFSLKPGPMYDKKNASDKEMHKVKQKFDEITDIVNQVFNIGTFNQAMHEFFLDLATGQGALLVQPSDSMADPVNFTAVNRADYAIEDNASNEITSVYRKMKVKGREIKRQWEDADLSKEMKNRIDNDEDQEFEFWEVTYEAEKEDPSSPTDTVWYYDVIWKGGDKEEHEARIVEREYKHNPWVIARWSKLPDETEGRGPLLYALPDIKTLNKVVEFTLKNASLAVSGVYTATQDGVVNPDNVKIEPGAIIPVASNGGSGRGPALQPLRAERDFDISQIVTNDLRNNIKAMLYNDDVPDQRGQTPRSASEIAQRVENLQREIHGSFGRLFKELIVPLVQRVVDILHYDKEMIELPPDIGKLGTELVVTSPMAQGQNLEDIRTVTQWLDLVGQVGGQEAMMTNVDIKEVIEYFSDKLGVEEKLKKSPEQKEQMAKMMKKMTQKAQKMQQAQAQAQAQAEQGQGGGGPKQAPPPQQGQQQQQQQQQQRQRQQGQGG